MPDVFAMIADERRILAAELESLDDVKWETQSAMPGWKVKHVAAHLVWPLESSMLKTIFQFGRNGFNFNKTADDVASKETRSRKELAAVLRDRADHKFTPPGGGPDAPLTDIIVHGQDIRAPLGLLREYPSERVHIVLNSLLKSRRQAFFGSPRGFSFAAPDVGWTGGSGALVSGPSKSLMHALTGRKSGLEGLSGEGVAAFRAAFKDYT